MRPLRRDSNLGPFDPEPSALTIIPPFFGQTKYYFLSFFKHRLEQDLFATRPVELEILDFCGLTLLGFSTVLPPFQKLIDKHTDRHVDRTGGALRRWTLVKRQTYRNVVKIRLTVRQKGLPLV